MLDIATLKVGDRVCYVSPHDSAQYENGRVKEIHEHTNTAVRVVYKCGGNWDKFMDYTSVLTDIVDLQKGWRSDTQQEEESD